MLEIREGGMLFPLGLPSCGKERLELLVVTFLPFGNEAKPKKAELRERKINSCWYN